MLTMKHVFKFFVLGFALNFITNLHGTLIHHNNIRQRTEDIAEKFITQHGIHKNSIPVKLLPEYLDRISKASSNAQQSINYRGQSYIDSEELALEVQKEMQNFINVMNSIVRTYNLEANITNAIHQELIAHGLTPDNVPAYMVNEYHQKGSLITSKLRSSMFNDRRDYVRKTEIEKIVHDELRTFIQRIKELQSTPSKPATTHTWHWWDTLFGSSPNKPTEENSLQIQRNQLNQKVLTIVYSILRSHNIDPDNIPARVVSDYSDATQKIISHLQNIMAVYWRDYVWVSEIETTARKELQPIIDKVRYKNEICSICLDAYKPNDRIGQLSCGHTFHNDCIHTWLEHKNDCPLCRAANVIVAKIENVP